MDKFTDPKRRKKRILYVITKSNWGGAQRYVYDLATSLPKKEFEVGVILGGEGELKSKLESSGIRVIDVEHLMRDIGIIKEIKVFFSFLKIFKSEKPNIVHLNSSKAGGLGALAGRLAGVKKIIFTAHGWPFNETRGLISRFLIHLASWLTGIFSHKTIVVSKHDQQQGESMPFVSNKIILVHNGIKSSKYLSKVSARKELMGEQSDNQSKKVWIGTIAELHSNKGIRYAIEALKIVREKMGIQNFVYIVIGEGEERANLKEIVEKLNLKDHVFFVGHKKNAKTYLKAFNVFISSSIKEGLPYAILEAGLAGVPVVASAVGGIPEIIEDMKSGILVKPKKPDEIALALEFLINQKIKRREFADNLEQKVENDYSMQSMINATADTYNSKE